MAISWISALKMVPWDVVVSNAPSVVEGARKLWKSSAKANTALDEAQMELPPDARMESLEAIVSDLQREMTSSAELIKALADQNAQLVQAVAVLRDRQRLFAAAIALLAIAAATCLLVLFTR